MQKDRQSPPQHHLHLHSLGRTSSELTVKKSKKIKRACLCAWRHCVETGWGPQTIERPLSKNIFVCCSFNISLFWNEKWWRYVIKWFDWFQASLILNLIIWWKQSFSVITFTLHRCLQSRIIESHRGEQRQRSTGWFWSLFSPVRGSKHVCRLTEV